MSGWQQLRLDFTQDVPFQPMCLYHAFFEFHTLEFKLLIKYLVIWVVVFVLLKEESQETHLNCVPVCPSCVLIKLLIISQAC